MAHYTNPAGYDRFMGRWSARLAPLFVDFVGPTDGLVLDVGCGTAVLSRTLLDLSPTVEVVGIDPARSYLDYARRLIDSPRIAVVCGTAEVLPFAGASFDAALALLVVQEFCEPAVAVREMKRVTHPGGVLATCVWDFRQGMPMFSLFWEAASAIAPDAVAPRRAETGGPSPYANRETLDALWRHSGLAEVRTTALQVPLDFTSVEDFWTPFLLGSTGTSAFARDLDAATGGAVSARVRQMIGERWGEGGFTLVATAFAVAGRA
ncbi:MAG TPA: class I SAM-dependent methyltransferase [Stellaceae bacterium]|nr:class I SAM-dependent methyltransferase [Stellaceae bacterium]